MAKISAGGAKELARWTLSSGHTFLLRSDGKVLVRRGTAWNRSLLAYPKHTAAATMIEKFKAQMLAMEGERK